MRKSMKCFILAFIIMLISTPLGYTAINTVYYNKNLSGEYLTILNGFIYLFMLIGVSIFIIGLVDMIVSKNNKE
ncbi:glycosyl transferase [Paenibacillus anaericanus]|uniref:Glycosyl transferase n=1 Tax=Paenibacillus anaericanus TaxID=170367 RepID=A0A433Y4E6_9BACL|nr:glycosyl transferase [Paenibacillus anaericanus]